MSEVKKTALVDEHIRLGGKMVEFAGWYMPVQFKGLTDEHKCVRSNVGLFDVSHMGELRVTGPNSLESLQWLTSNDVSKLNAGEAQYSLLTNFDGGVVDDLIVYCFAPGEDYLLCVNAANIDKDFAWITKHNKGATVTDESSKWSQIAIQGPRAVELTEKVYGTTLKDIESFNFRQVDFNGQSTIVARTGYTGEDGFEVFVPNDQAVKLWQALLSQREAFGVQPIGLGARDTLRTEKKFSLYGHEIDDHSNPYEAGLGWVVKPGAKDFIGKEPITKKKEQGLARKLVGFKMQERGIARAGYPLLSFDKIEIGAVTSGTPSPSSGDNIGIGYVPVEYAEPGKEFLVGVRSRTLKAVVVKTPFV